MPRKFLFFLFFIALSLGLFFAASHRVFAVSLGIPKDTISTSRPSASAPINANAAAAVNKVTFYDNGTRFIASDSAKLIGQTLEVVTVASMSASSGSPAVRTVYFTGATANAHTNGTVVMTPTTAKHTISFTTVNAVPSNGLIKIILPVGDASNQASPSATGFSFNGLTNTANLAITGATCGSWTVTASTGLIQCNLSAAISTPTAISIGIGSSTPVLINPTKTAAAGTADTWTVQILTTENDGTEINTSKVKIGTIDSVEVYATVDPTLTFTIAGLTNNAAVNIGNTAGCTNTEVINTGFNSTATEVNLGVLGAGVVNRSAQLMTISTNGAGGYSLTATASGHLIGPEVGYWLPDAQGTPTNNDTPVPLVLNEGTPTFGIHPCGVDVTSGTWGTGASGGGTGAKYANPSPSYYYTLASDTTGPIGNSITAGNGLVTVEYGATISSVVPAGVYRTTLTYVATPTF